MNKSRSIFAAVSLLYSLSAPTRAEILQFQFSGIVDDVRPSSLVSSRSAKRSAAPSWLITTSSGFLYDASGLSLVISGDYGVSGQAGSLSILNDFGGVFDSFHTSFDGPLMGGALNGRATVEFDLSLTSPNTAFSSSSVPLLIPVESAIGVQSSIDFAPDDGDTLTFRVTALAPVPEPALLGMLGVDALLLASRSRAMRGA